MYLEAALREPSRRRFSRRGHAGRRGRATDEKRTGASAPVARSPGCACRGRAESGPVTAEGDRAGVRRHTVRVLLLAFGLAGVIAEPLLSFCHHDSHPQHRHHRHGDSDPDQPHAGDRLAAAEHAHHRRDADSGEPARGASGSFAAAATRPGTSLSAAGPAARALAPPERSLVADHAGYLACSALIVQPLVTLVPGAVAALGSALPAISPSRPALDPVTPPP